MRIAFREGRAAFEARVARAQCAAFFGLPVEDVMFVAERHEHLNGGGYYVRPFYAMRDGSVWARGTDKSYRRLTKQETIDAVLATEVRS